MSVGVRMHPLIYRIRRCRKACSVLFLHIVVVMVRNAAEFGPYFVLGPGKIIFSPLCFYIHILIPSTVETRKTGHKYGTIGGNQTGCVGCCLSDADVYGPLAARLRLPSCPVARFLINHGGALCCCCNLALQTGLPWCSRRSTATACPALAAQRILDGYPPPPPVRDRYLISVSFACFVFAGILAIFVYFFFVLLGAKFGAAHAFFQRKSIAGCMLCLGFSLSLSLSLSIYMYFLRGRLVAFDTF